MTRKRKLVIAILVMSVLVLCCVWFLFFVPHTAQTLIAMNRVKVGPVESAEQALTAETTIVLDQSDLESLKGLGEESIEVPITITIAAETGPGTAHFNKTIDYVVFDETGTTTSESYYDSDGAVLYSLKQNGWTLRGNVSPTTYDINALFEAQCGALDGAAFGFRGGAFTLTFPAEDIGSVLIVPFTRDADELTITGGTVTFTYDFWSRTMTGLSTEDLTICRTSAVGSAEEADATSGISIRADFGRQNELEAEEYVIPDEVVAAAEANEEAQTASDGDWYILSVEDLNEREENSYTVGIDIPAGTYVIRQRRGAGIIKILDGSDASEILVYKSGYGYYRNRKGDRAE